MNVLLISSFKEYDIKIEYAIRKLLKSDDELLILSIEDIKRKEHYKYTLVSRYESLGINKDLIENNINEIQYFINKYNNLFYVEDIFDGLRNCRKIILDFNLVYKKTIIVDGNLFIDLKYRDVDLDYSFKMFLKDNKYDVFYRRKDNYFSILTEKEISSKIKYLIIFSKDDILSIIDFINTDINIIVFDKSFYLIDKDKLNII